VGWSVYVVYTLCLAVALAGVLFLRLSEWQQRQQRRYPRADESADAKARRAQEERETREFLTDEDWDFLYNNAVTAGCVNPEQFRPKPKPVPRPAPPARPACSHDRWVGEQALDERDAWRTCLDCGLHWKVGGRHFDCSCPECRDRGTAREAPLTPKVCEHGMWMTAVYPDDHIEYICSECYAVLPGSAWK